MAAKLPEVVNESPQDWEGTMPIIGYGEDGLTYWALTNKLQDILDNFQDNSTECTAYYRVSCGRSGGKKSSQFGEFDAILATPQKIYLIESKWDNGGRPPQVLVLKEVQTLRHLIFTWLLQRWREDPQANWQAFRKNAIDAFTQEFPNRQLARSGKLLARNLEYLLPKLTGKEIVNVLLYFYREGFQPPKQIVNTRGQSLTPPFTLVPVCYCPLGKSGFFPMEDKPMVKAVVNQGGIRPLESLPVDWQEGQRLRVEKAENREPSVKEIDRDFSILANLCGASEPADEEHLERAVQEARRQAKEQVRRQMGLP
jgi:hypothetical protein